ncbi:hypothetical protein SEA_SPILLED_224 [Streptomyces phage Spilled]|uniref:Uncharacterized protein n=4 Tax=Streptomyces virus Karimac TaxID=2846401 RepID=A0A5Q2WN43_9CAUD|nr:hypothetical protein HWB80_gp103 [Streptomyces phage Karimac]AXH66680.1 hypothetical protein SEA_STARBOW_214 [Streptomyces phage Starbow]QDF17342.1 hypothetical protein SEA_BIRCHLYN_216 [Streptomyces phage Birchlyn]QFP97491.1 hypothetical protein SEA_ICHABODCRANE_212 [Streptomyces phage IchabodCrane]QGH74418.1 hypothetical protein SEA_WIPEOUT_208 [Streptomyces phage Wipeout]QGH79067.1 hypothetical protein SEA_TOMSAWYER_221 [Streptomyces phage TomSawyer]QGH79942.1 hypothetical protein SEA_B
MPSLIDITAASIALIHPGAPYEWIEKAAKEMIWFSSQNPNPSIEQMDALNERINKMCTTGEW